MAKVKSVSAAKRLPARKLEAPATRRGEARRQALLDAARDVFLEKGFAGTSVEAVMARVGGSKATLYSYFGNKDGLFGGMVDMHCNEFFANLAIPQQIDGDIEQTLLKFARRALKLFTDPQRIAMMRVMISEAARFPELAEKIYTAGPRRGIATLGEFLGRAHAAGQIHCPRPDIAAIQLMELIKAHPQWRAMMGFTPFTPGIDPDEFIREGVHRFLYGCTRPHK